MSEREKRIAEIRGRLSSDDAWIDIFEQETDKERTRYIMVAPDDLAWCLGEIERLERALTDVLPLACSALSEQDGLDFPGYVRACKLVDVDPEFRAHEALKGGDA